MNGIKNKGIWALLMMVCLSLNSLGQNTLVKQDSAMLARFYKTVSQPVFWFSSEKNIKRADEWLTVIASREVRIIGFDSGNADIERLKVLLKGAKRLDEAQKKKTDPQITVLVLRLIKFLQQGNAPFEYEAFRTNRDSIYISWLLESVKKGSAETSIAGLECKDPDYKLLKQFLMDSVSDKTSVMAKKINLSMNYLRYLCANANDEKIVVNIPEAHAVYYRDKLPSMDMRVVPGTKDDPTPTMASYITSIITFPPWKVPYEIGVNEILPEVQKDEKYLEENNFEVVDKKENVVDIKDLKWEEYDKNNFPYLFRQLSGPDNALGVIKFNLRNPLSIYLHATSWHGAFQQESRFLSHGCVRLEKPFDLANAILRGKIEREELAKVRDSIETREYKIDRRVPTYLIYMPAIVKGKKVILLNDVYGLIQQ